MSLGMRPMDDDVAALLARLASMSFIAAARFAAASSCGSSGSLRFLPEPAAGSGVNDGLAHSRAMRLPLLDIQRFRTEPHKFAEDLRRFEVWLLCIHQLVLGTAI